MLGAVYIKSTIEQKLTTCRYKNIRYNKVLKLDYGNKH